ncbi:unnamed protein product [Enterobius vermicularis]|uniref:Uncharacterized protein n=1 Tax=Enterobius vermicularis TaxID=51028 RepID=A0A0N4VGL5_ENTVE|nr:unnamed protein product [Enterobius vermicularis]
MWNNLCIPAVYSNVFRVNDRGRGEGRGAEEDRRERGGLKEGGSRHAKKEKWFGDRKIGMDGYSVWKMSRWMDGWTDG